MATPTGFWSWLSNPDNQKTLAFIGGGLAAVAAAGWQIYVHFADTRAPAPPPAPSIVTPSGVPSGSVTVEGNVSGGTIITGGTVTIGPAPADPEQAKKLIESQAKALDAITGRMGEISRAIETGDASKLSPADAKK